MPKEKYFSFRANCLKGQSTPESWRKPMQMYTFDESDDNLFFHYNIITIYHTLSLFRAIIPLRYTRSQHS